MEEPVATAPLKSKNQMAVLSALERLAVLSIYDSATGTSCIAVNLEADLGWVIKLLHMMFQAEGRSSPSPPNLTEREYLGGPK
jgi:hypothetical protein